MKILFIINNLGVGGAERLVVDDINELLKRGVDVHLLTLKPEKQGRSLVEQCKIRPSYFHSIPFGSLWNLKSWWKAFCLLKKLKPDVVWSHLWFANLISRVVGKVLGVRVITFEHNVYDTLKTWKMFWLDRALQNWSRKIVAVSQAVKVSLLQHGIREAKICVIPNGLDISKFQTEEKKNPDSNFIFIFIGRLIQQKAVDILLQAFAQTQKAQLWLVGEGAEKGNLLGLIERLGLEERVKFLGLRSDIANLLNQADCFVLPSRYEGLPMVLVEALAAGQAIIVSDFQSAREVIRDGVNGLVFARENVEQLTIAMRKIQTDSALAERLRKQAKSDSQKFSIQSHIDQLLKLSEK